MLRLLFLLLLSLCVTLQPHPCGSLIRVAAQNKAVNDEIVVGPVSPEVAKKNREAIENKDGEVRLPVGTILFDAAPKLKSNVSLIGTDNSTILRQMYTGGDYPKNSTVATAGTGVSHVDFFTHVSRYKIKVAQAVADKIGAGTLIYVWVSTNNAPSPVVQRRTVTNRVADVLTLDQSVDMRCNVLKWFVMASPINDVAEGADTVTIQAGAINLPPPTIDSWVFVTSGPSIANEATGELRKVKGTALSSVRLDRALRRGYKNAVLARIQPAHNVTIRDLVIDMPINPAAECFYASLCEGWTIQNCTIRKTALGNCANLTFDNCTLGWVQAAASSHDLRFTNCRINSITFEEGCHDLLINNSQVGPVGANMNCVSLRAQSERLTIRNTFLMGGLWPSSQIYCDSPARECVFESIRMFGKVPCWIYGDRLLFDKVFSDGDINVSGAGIVWR